MSNTIDDGLKASLATLELVKYSYASRVGENALSTEEVESAHRSLLQIAQAAESIKQKLPSSVIEKKIDDNALGSTGPKRDVVSVTEDSGNKTMPLSPSVHADEKTIVDRNGNDEPPEAKNTLLVNENRDKSSNDSCSSSGDTGRITDNSGVLESKSSISQRRLSTPCLMPMDVTDIGVSVSFHKKCFDFVGVIDDSHNSNVGNGLR